MISFTRPASLSRVDCICSRNSPRSSSLTLGLRSTWAMPLATVTGVRSSCETFARNWLLAFVPSSIWDSMSRTCSSSSLTRARDAPSSPPSRVAALRVSTIDPAAADTIARAASSTPSSFNRYPEAPADNTCATRLGSRRRVQPTMADSGAASRSRRTRWTSFRPSRPSSVAMTSGWMPAAISITRSDSVVTSISMAGSSMRSACCSRVTSSAVSHRRTFTLLVSVSRWVG